MNRNGLLFGLAVLVVCGSGNLHAHCQLPCGIYHDDMVYEEIDQYVETMFKGVSVLDENKFSTPTEKNQIIRWIINKEESSNGIATRITEYFLQQKIKPGEEDTDRKLRSAHKLLFLLVQIKQNVSLKIIKDFNDEWENFKLLFHSKDYECEMEKARLIPPRVTQETDRTESSVRSSEKPSKASVDKK